MPDYVYRGTGRDDLTPWLSAGSERAAATRRAPRATDPAGYAREQKKMLQLVARDFSNEQIAQAMGLTLHSTKNRVRLLLAEYHADSRLALAVAGVRVGDLKFKPMGDEVLPQITAAQRQLLQFLANVGSVLGVERVHNWRRSSQYSELKAIATRWGVDSVAVIPLVMKAMRAGWVK